MTVSPRHGVKHSVNLYPNQQQRKTGIQRENTNQFYLPNIFINNMLCSSRQRKMLVKATIGFINSQSP